MATKTGEFSGIFVIGEVAAENHGSRFFEKCPTQIASNGENLPPSFVVGRFFRPKNKKSLNKQNNLTRGRDHFFRRFNQDAGQIAACGFEEKPPRKKAQKHARLRPPGHGRRLSGDSTCRGLR